MANTIEDGHWTFSNCFRASDHGPSSQKGLQDGSGTQVRSATCASYAVFASCLTPNFSATLRSTSRVVDMKLP